MRRLLPPLCFCAVTLALLVAPACDEATPVAPVGSLLTISANPAQIEPFGSSLITVVARKEDGTPVNPGTEVIFSATLGEIAASVATDDLGVATATLTGDGRVGTSTVTALSGAAESVSVDIQIGSFPGSITLLAQPTVVTEAGAEIDLTATVRDEAGQLLDGAAVNFSTDLGLLASGGSAVFTDAQGAARDVLTVTGDDIEGREEESFEVRAETADQAGQILTATFEVAIQRLAPEASFDAVEGANCSVVFTNTTTGRDPITFEWDFDGDGIVDSTASNPTFDYVNLIVDTDGDGTKCPDDPDLPDDTPATDDTQFFTVTLTAFNDLGQDVFVDTVEVDPN